MGDNELVDNIKNPEIIVINENNLNSVIDRIKYQSHSESLAGFTFEDIDFSNSGYRYLPDANLAGATFNNVKFIKGYLYGANLAGATFNNVDFTLACLEKANIAGATFNNVNFNLAILDQANFDGSNLKNVNLETANITGASFKEVVSSGVVGVPTLSSSLLLKEYTNSYIRNRQSDTS